LAKDGDTRLRSLAILALSKMGVAARPAFEPLKAALADPDELTRKYAADALKGIGADGRAAVTAAGKDGEKP
jgi:HEAT repeat protein